MVTQGGDGKVTKSIEDATLDELDDAALAAIVLSRLDEENIEVEIEDL